MLATHGRALFWAFLLQPMVALAGLALARGETGWFLLFQLVFALTVVVPVAIVGLTVALVRRRLGAGEASVSFLLISAYVVIGVGTGMLGWPSSLHPDALAYAMAVSTVTYLVTAASFVGVARGVNALRRSATAATMRPSHSRSHRTYPIAALLSGLILFGVWFYAGERQWHRLPEPRRFNHSAVIEIIPHGTSTQVGIGRDPSIPVDQSPYFGAGLKLKDARGNDIDVSLSIECAVPQGWARRILARTIGADAGGRVMVSALSGRHLPVELKADNVPVTQAVDRVLWLDVDALAALTKAAGVSGSVGETAFVWTPEQLEAFRDFASRVRTLRVGS